jgi:hypothetical protein
VITDFIGMGVCVAVAALIFWEMINSNRRARRAPVRTAQQAIEELERHADRWETLHLAGHTPVWVEGRGWMEHLCACGYTDECAVHCGDGHETGRCAPANAHRVELSAAEFARIMHENLRSL